MRDRRLRIALWLVALSIVAAVAWPSPAQAAACTGWCYLSSSGPYCGFTALQEGGKCSVVYDIWLGTVCTLRACSSGPGSWEPENQGRLPFVVEPEPAERLADRSQRIVVTVLEPRT